MFYQNGSFVDWCVESDFYSTNDPEEIISYVLPYMIVPDNKPSDSAFIGLIMAGAGLVLLIVAILMLRKAKETSTLKTPEDTSAPQEPIAPQMPVQEYAAPEPAPPSGARLCPHCGTVLEDRARFCPACGANVEEA